MKKDILSFLSKNHVYIAVASILVLIAVAGSFVGLFMNANSITQKSPDINVTPVVHDDLTPQSSTGDNVKSDSTNKSNSTASSPSTPQVSQPNASKVYIPIKCTEKAIPFETIYEESSTVPLGEQKIYQEGRNGSITTCTPDSNGRTTEGWSYPARNKIIQNGTYVKPPTYNPPKNYSTCNQFSGTGAYEACINAINQQ